jgi:hypothetical protein
LPRWKRNRLEKTALPRKVAVILLERRNVGSHYGTCRFDISELQLVLRPQRLGLRHRSCNAGFSLRHGGAVIILDQLGEYLPFAHTFVVLYRKLAHVAGNLGRYGRQIGLQVRIVRPLPPCAALPARPIRRYDDDDPNGDDEYKDSPCKLKKPVPVNLRNAHRLLLQPCSHIEFS